jgi:hypothetical protein
LTGDFVHLRTQKKPKLFREPDILIFNLIPFDELSMMESATNHHIDVIEGSYFLKQNAALFSFCLFRLNKYLILSAETILDVRALRVNSARTSTKDALTFFVSLKVQNGTFTLITPGLNQSRQFALLTDVRLFWHCIPN